MTPGDEIRSALKDLKSKIDKAMANGLVDFKMTTGLYALIEVENMSIDRVGRAQPEWLPVCRVRAIIE